VVLLSQSSVVVRAPSGPSLRPLAHPCAVFRFPVIEYMIQDEIWFILYSCVADAVVDTLKKDFCQASVFLFPEINAKVRYISVELKRLMIAMYATCSCAWQMRDGCSNVPNRG
jgi:hypothetical protein